MGWFDTWTPPPKPAPAPRPSPGQMGPPSPYIGNPWSTPASTIVPGEPAPPPEDPGPGPAPQPQAPVGDGGAAAAAAAYAAMQQQLADQYGAGKNAVDANDAALRQQFAELQAQQQAGAKATQYSMQADAARNASAYNAAVNPIINDLQAQGFSASPVQQRITLDQLRLADAANRQSAFSQNLQQVQDRSFADRNASAGMIHTGALGALQNNYFAALAGALNGGSSSGGKGGRGGGGSGGSGDSGVSATDRAIAEMASNADGANIPGYVPRFQGTTKAGQNAYDKLMGAASKGGVNGFLAAWNQVQNKANKAHAAGKSAGFNVKGFQNSVVNDYLNYQKKVASAAAAKSNVAASNLHYLGLR